MFQKIDHNMAYVFHKKTSKTILIWLLIMIVILISFCLIVFLYSYYPYDRYQGYLQNGHVIIYTKKVNHLKQGKVYIEQKEYQYKIVNISKDYYLVNNSNYYLVELEINLDDKYLIENNIMELYIRNDKTTLFQTIKKGLNL